MTEHNNLEDQLFNEIMWRVRLSATAGQVPVNSVELSVREALEAQSKELTRLREALQIIGYDLAFDPLRWRQLAQEALAEQEGGR